MLRLNRKLVIMGIMIAINVLAFGNEVMGIGMDAYFSRNYYTREKEAKFIVEIEGSDEEALGSMKLEITVLEPGTGRIVVKKAVSAARESITLDISGLKEAEYPVTLSLLDKDGNSIATFKETLRKLAPRDREVKIDKENRVILLNDKPYFMLGLYDTPYEYIGNVVPAEFNALAQEPALFTFVMNRGEFPAVNTQETIKWLIEYLDKAQANNLNVILNISHGGAWEADLAKEGGILDAVIPAIRDHPALLAYHSARLPSIKGVVKKLYDTLRRLDPYHPVFPVSLGRIFYQEGWDIACMDNSWRPRTQTPLRVAQRTDKAVTIAKEKHKPFIDLPSCIRWSASERELTPAEHRAQTYLDIVHGTVGFFWYKFRPYAESLWDEMRKLNMELRELSPVILSNTPEQQVIDANPAQPVHTLIKEYGDKIYLVTVNGQEREVDAGFSFTDGLKDITGVNVLFEGRKLDPNGSGFRDSFPAFGSRVYEISGVREGKRYDLRIDTKIKSKKRVVKKRKNAPNKTGIINLIPNSSAEATTNPDLPDYWNVVYWKWEWDSKLKLYVDREDSVDGYNSIRIQKPSLRIPSYYLTRKIDWMEPHTFSLYMKADKENVPVKVQFGSPYPYPGIKEEIETVEVGKTWKRYVFTKTFENFEPMKYVPKTMAMMVLMVPGEGEKVWVDAVQVEKGDKVHPYTEDKATVAYWEGNYATDTSYQSARFFPAATQRIDRQIKVLRAESLAESIRKLDEVSMYYWPGQPDSRGITVRFPLEKGIDAYDAQIVMSNRRFLKVFQDVSTLSEAEAGSIVAGEIEATLATYWSLFRDAMENKRSPSKSGVSFSQIGNNPDGSPTLRGCRYKLLALLLMAGNMELKEAGPAVIEVAREAKSQRQLFYDKDQFEMHSAFFVLFEGSLYSRPILCTALLGTCMNPSEAEKLVSTLGVEWKKKKLTHYDASGTPYDLHARMGVGVDYSKGELTVRYLGDLDDTQFDGILQRAVSTSRD